MMFEIKYINASAKVREAPLLMNYFRRIAERQVQKRIDVRPCQPY